MAGRKVLVIAGPTATGKSAMSLDLAMRFPIEVISADSMQIYRGMDIGTDKVSLEQRAQVRHHLIDIKDPDEPWSVEEFKSLASQAIEDISGRGLLPCIVGGTGLYIRALLRDFPLQDRRADWELRRVTDDQMAAEKGKPRRVQRPNCEIGTRYPTEPSSNDRTKRVIRALDTNKATGAPISERLLVQPVSPMTHCGLDIVEPSN